MAKSQREEWVKPDKLMLIQGWKRNGLTDEQIAGNIGISPRTFERWKSKESQIRQVLKGSKEIVNFQVENKLLKKAKEGNMTAIIFWLKNNWRDKYNDSTLSKEERIAIFEKTRKSKAEADIAEFKAEMLSKNSGNSEINIDIGIGEWNDED